MATLDIPNGFLAAAPVIVTAPTTRCGTTLVQRLLTASDNAFVYGEEIGSQFKSLASLFAQQINIYENQHETADAAFDQALAGGLHDWRPGLTPPSTVTLNAWVQTYYQLPVALAAFGQSIGRPIWGFKWPACPPDLLRTYMILMPRAKVVYVMRNLVDALKSAKARRFVETPEQAAGFCSEWAHNVRSLDALADDPRVLVVKYEALVEDRAGQASRLAAFTGAKTLRLSEFDVKVNTFEGSETLGHSPTQYIAPHPLTDADLTAVHAIAAAEMARYYPEFAEA
jgi:hypothetical protein